MNLYDRLPGSMMMKRTMSDLMEILEAHECLLAVGFNDCIITHTYGDDVRAVYSTGRVIQKLISQGMDQEDAWEYFSYNILGGNPGTPSSPVFINDLSFFERDLSGKATENIL